MHHKCSLKLLRSVTDQSQLYCLKKGFWLKGTDAVWDGGFFIKIWSPVATEKIRLTDYWQLTLYAVEKSLNMPQSYEVSLQNIKGTTGLATFAFPQLRRALVRAHFNFLMLALSNFTPFIKIVFSIKKTDISTKPMNFEFQKWKFSRLYIIFQAFFQGNSRGSKCGITKKSLRS